jgi:hypothetical protein
MQNRMLAALAAVALLSVSQGALAQSAPHTQAPPESASPPNPSVVAPAEPSSQTPARSETSVTPQAQAGEQPHNSTTGAASTDVPTPSVVTHILSGQDAAKFNAETAANDAKPTMAHAFGLTDEQKRLIASSVTGKDESAKPALKPEIATLMPPSLKVQDLPGDVTAKIPWLMPYKVALAGDQVLIVDPVNSHLVVGIIDR